MPAPNARACGGPTARALSGRVRRTRCRVPFRLSSTGTTPLFLPARRGNPRQDAKAPGRPHSQHGFRAEVHPPPRLSPCHRTSPYACRCRVRTLCRPARAATCGCFHGATITPARFRHPSQERQTLLPAAPSSVGGTCSSTPNAAQCPGLALKEPAADTLVRRRLSNLRDQCAAPSIQRGVDGRGGACRNSPAAIMSYGIDSA